MARTPREHDEETLRLMSERSREADRRDSGRNAMHRMAGDKQDWHGRRQYWRMSTSEVLAVVQRLMDDGDKPALGSGLRPSELLGREEGITEAVQVLDEKIDALEAAYQARPWPRYFPCLNADGHVHRSIRSSECGTMQAAMGWETELSGKTVEEAIALLGPRLCSKCFPDAPVEWCRSLRDITREQREQEKADRARAKREAGEAKAQRAAEREQRAAQPRKMTAAGRRGKALLAIQATYQSIGDVTRDREQAAADIRALAPLGKTSRWTDVVAWWAESVMEDDFTWGDFINFCIRTSHAVE